MKLAEALLEKKSALATLAQLPNRISGSAFHEEGDTPDENAFGLIQKMKSLSTSVQLFTIDINKANNVAMVGEKTMMECIAERDALKMDITRYDSVISAISSGARRRHGADKKIVLAQGVVIQNLIADRDTKAKTLRLLDIEMQKVNWSYDM